MSLVLVTGATGLVGNNVVRLLLERGESVRALVRDGADPRPLEGLPVDLACGDVRDCEAVRAACQNVTAIVHAAGLVHIGRTGLERHRAVNVQGTIHVADAACDTGVRMIYVSSVDALGLGSADQPADELAPLSKQVLCPYVVTKREAEAAVLQRVEKGLDAVIVNPGFMLGPWDWKPSSGRMLLGVAAGKCWFAPRGVNSYCHVVDVAAGILAALDHGRSGQRYILAGQSLSYLEAWTQMAEVSGGRKPICRAGPLMMILAGVWGDMRARLTGSEGDVNSASVAMSRLPKYYSSARAEAELGYRTRSLREAANDAWNWLREYGYVSSSE